MFVKTRTPGVRTSSRGGKGNVSVSEAEVLAIDELR